MKQIPCVFEYPPLDSLWNLYLQDFALPLARFSLLTKKITSIVVKPFTPLIQPLCKFILKKKISWFYQSLSETLRSTNLPSAEQSNPIFFPFVSVCLPIQHENKFINIHKQARMNSHQIIDFFNQFGVFFLGYWIGVSFLPHNLPKR